MHHDERLLAERACRRLEVELFRHGNAADRVPARRRLAHERLEALARLLTQLLGHVHAGEVVLIDLVRAHVERDAGTLQLAHRVRLLKLLALGHRPSPA